ncbi:hypothetical protein TraAM80_04938 [Trypanosoma rangeli]|uniref:Uncharacterized protein n=1 Tax=Trypanosoma rangeli TaxID=5698 RepID=A0A422NGP2_TRYRA|nr:uncharacterized protein TraAM80_04938 [Trypanosoma rangeli]RNF04643.1 hypothetical protein TraAM80_04938 [Trypanosoma rangeli]|eukprot:RNF04643.1 hypothetical protein TraAM80_04938 [Trypanosoma rangeli]
MRHGDGKPPVAPRSTSCEKPKSILKNTNSGSASTKTPSPSRRRVSFEEDDSFTEPRLCFGTPTHAPRPHHEAAAGGNEPVVAQWETTSRRRAGVQIERAADLGPSEPTIRCDRPAASSPNSPHNSPVITPYPHSPPASNNYGDEGTAGGTLASNDRPLTAVLSCEPAAGAAVPRSTEELSPLPDVSVSDITPSPPSLVSRQGRSDSSRSPMNNCAVAAAAEQCKPPDVRETLFPDRDACTVRAAPNIGKQLPSGTTNSPSHASGELGAVFFGQALPERGGRDVLVQPSSRHPTWYGGSAEAVVRPSRTRDPTEANTGCHSSSLPFEGGVNPADLVFDDSPKSSVLEAEEIKNEFPVVSGSSRSRRVLDFPVQLYPSLVGLDGPPHSTAPLEPSPSNATDDDRESTLQRRSGRKGRRAAGDSDRTPMPLQPVLRVKNAGKPGEHLSARQPPAQALDIACANARDAVEELTNGVVRGTGEALALKENQNPLLCRDHGSTADGASPSSLLSYAHAYSNLPPTQARPVVVKYINKLSASWQETLRGDVHDGRRRHNRGHFDDDTCPLRPRQEVTRQLFPGVFFGHASLMTEACHANCLEADTAGVCPLLSIKSTEVVLPKPMKAKKQRGGAKPATTTVTTTASAVAVNNNSSCSIVETRRVELTKSSPETHIREGACAVSEEFEDVDSYCVPLAPAANVNPSVVENVKSEEEGEEEKERRAKRFEKLRRALLLVSGEGMASPSGGSCVTGCGADCPPPDRDYGCPTAVTALTEARRHVSVRQRRNLVPLLSSATTEGLIHTPERVPSPDRGEEPPATRSKALFAPARSVSPPRSFSCSQNANVRQDALGGGVAVLPERRVSNRTAARAFARDISAVVHALRESTWVKIL